MCSKSASDICYPSSVLWKHPNHLKPLHRPAKPSDSIAPLAPSSPGSSSIWWIWQPSVPSDSFWVCPSAVSLVTGWDVPSVSKSSPASCAPSRPESIAPFPAPKCYRWPPSWVPPRAILSRSQPLQGRVRMPMTAPVSSVPIVPATIAFKPNPATIRLCSGQRALSVPAKIPMLLKLAKPHSE